MERVVLMDYNEQEYQMEEDINIKESDDMCPSCDVPLGEETIGEGKKQLVCPKCGDVWS